MKGSGAICYTFPDEMVSDIDVFCIAVVDRVLDQELSPTIVDEEGSRITNVLFEVMHELSKPDGFLSSLSGCNVLGLSGGLGHTGLELRPPGDWATGKQEEGSRDGVTSVRVHGIIGVSKSIDAVL